MRRILFALALFLSFTLPTAARADSFHYTIVWDFPHIATADTSAFVGTYSFTVDSLLQGNTLVYGPSLPTNNFTVFPYVYAADYTIPAGSNVSEIQIAYFPDYTPYNSFGQKTLYGVGLYQTAGGRGVTTTLAQDPSDPNKFYGDYGDGSGDFVSMQITPVSTASPVPEPSTIALLGIGFVATGIFARRRRTCTSGSTL
jgi:hypothetical protein